MAIRKTIGSGHKPVEEAATLDGQEAKEHKFVVGNVTHVRVGLKKGHKPVAKELPDNLPSGDGFTPIRLVMNLKLVDDANKTVTRSRLRLHVRYLAEDLQAAGGKPLKLAHWHAGHWTVLGVTWSPDNPKDEKSEGYAHVQMDEWPDDPPIAVGHT